VKKVTPAPETAVVASEAPATPEVQVAAKAEEISEAGKTPETEGGDEKDGKDENYIEDVTELGEDDDDVAEVIEGREKVEDNT